MYLDILSTSMLCCTSLDFSMHGFMLQLDNAEAKSSNCVNIKFDIVTVLTSAIMTLP